MRKTVLFILSLFIITLLAAQNTVTDIDGNVYKTVKIGTQVWMAENLRTTKYNDGTEIPLVTDNNIWSNLINGAYCTIYNTVNQDTISLFGRLYNWNTIKTNKVCPLGWHVPKYNEWDTLINYMVADGYNYDATTYDNKIAKSLAATSLWVIDTYDPGCVGNDLSKNNKSGFNAYPSGTRAKDGTFYQNSTDCYWWQSDSTTQDGVNGRSLDDAFNPLMSTVGDLGGGCSIRCLYDSVTISLKADKKIVCSSDPVILTVKAFGGFQPYTYKWNILGYVNSSIIVFPTVNTKYYVTVNDANGTTRSDSILIIVKQPTTSITNATICQGDRYLFNGNLYFTAGIYTFHLTNSVGCDSAAHLELKIKLPSSSTITTAACQSFTFHGKTYTNSGIYFIHEINAVGCDSVITLYLKIQASSSTTNAIICHGDNYLFNGNTYSTTGTFTIHLTNSVGCDSTAILILKTVGFPFIQLPNDSIFCNTVNQIINVTDTSATYQWQGENASSIIAIDKVTSGYIIDGSTVLDSSSFSSKLESFILSKGGTYTVTVTNACGIYTDSIKIGVVSSPTIKLATDTLLCTGKPILLDISLAGSNKYLWQDYSTNPKYTISKGGTYSVSVTDSNNCMSSQAIVVHELAAPQFNFPNDSVVCDEILMPIDISCTECEYVWNNGNTSSKYTISNSGFYSVTVSNNCGTVKDSVKITVNDCQSFLDVPTAFSPNGDGLNDVLYAEGRNVENLSFVIYDRWGQRVFESKGLTDGWDGSFKGRTLESATFMYSISATAKGDGKKIEKKGNVILIR